MSMLLTWLKAPVGKKDSLCETLWNLCASVVNLAQKTSTTEAQSSHRGPQSLFSDGLLKPDINETNMSTFEAKPSVDEFRAPAPVE